MKYFKILTIFFLAVQTVHAAPFFPVQGGTGTSTIPTLGQVLVGQSNGTYSPQATSTLGIGGDTLTFDSPNLERDGDDVFFRNFSVFLGQGGRATLAHDNAMNTASFSYTHLVPRPQGNATYSTGKGGIGDDFYFNIVVNTSGGVVANMKKTPQNVSATAPSGTIGSRNWHEIRLSYNDATDRKLYLYVDDVLVATSTAFSTGTAFSNTDDFIWDMGAGVTYFTRPIFSSDPDYNPDMANVVTDADTIFYFPIRSTKTNPVDTVNGWTMSLDSETNLWFGDELPFGLDGQIQALLDTLNNKIGNSFWWDKEGQGVAIMAPFCFLDWEGSDNLCFVSEEEVEAGWQGDFNFQTKQNLAGGAIFGAPARLKGYTVAGLPTGTQGDMAYVTNALTPTWGATVVGGGSVVVPVFFNGTNWIVN